MIARAVNSPRSWGPPLWNFLFVYAFRASTDKEVRTFRQICALLRRTLPCDDCRSSYNEIYAAEPPPAANQRQACARWLWRVKDCVNQKLEKPFVPFSHAVAAFAPSSGHADEALARCVADVERWLGAVDAYARESDARAMRTHVTYALRALEAHSGTSVLLDKVE